MYYSKIRVDPSNPEIVYTTGASASKSIDGGKKFDTMGGQSHGDHHQLWINPRNGNHLIIGNDGGIDVSYDQGETWEEISLMALGQFYAISADMRKAVLRVRRAAGQRIVVRSERGAQQRLGDHQQRLVPDRWR